MSKQSLKIGDTVIIIKTKQIGTIIDITENKYTIKIADGNQIIKESVELKKRQVLLG